MKNEEYKKLDVYCKCGKFLYGIKNNRIRLPRSVALETDGTIFEIKCSCKEKATINLPEEIKF